MELPYKNVLKLTSYYNVLDCSNCIAEVIKTKEDKINDLKAKSMRDPSIS